MISTTHSESLVITHSIFKNSPDNLTSFTERPSLNRYSIIETGSQSKIINANELFSLFTANIIKEKVIFIR